MTVGTPTFRKIAKRRHHTYKHKEIALILDYLGQAELPGTQSPSSMKIRGFSRVRLGVGTKGELSQAIQTGFPSVTGIHLLESLMLTDKRRLSIISKRITSDLESNARAKHWFHSA
jgi:hypothetical protein